MLSPFVLGIIASVTVAFPLQVVAFLGSRFPNINLTAPIFLLGVTGVAMLLQKFVLDRRSGARGYDGLPDLFIHIHTIGAPDHALRWLIRGVNSLCLALFGGVIGFEGAAAEFSHAAALRLRSRSADQFEQRRRTDASVALAAGVSAAFNAPFAGILLPIELGIGGPIRPVVVASLTAFAGVKMLGSVFSSSIYYNFQGVLSGFQLGWKEGFGLLTIACVAGGAVALLSFFLRFVQDNVRDLFQTQWWMRTLAAGVLLFFVAAIYKSGHAFPNLLFEKLIWGRFPGTEIGFLLLTQVLVLALVLAGFGTIGILWPLFVAGAALGAGLNFFVFHEMAGFGAAAGLAGAAALFGGMLGSPLTAALLAWEVTGSPQALVIGGAAAFLAQLVVRFLHVPSLIESNLSGRGVHLIDGRSAAVLESIFARDAMMCDHDVVHEHETIADIYGRLIKSKYPFLPVTTTQGQFKGLLTTDMVQDAWEDHQRSVSSERGASLIKLLEAKDLLYRAGADAHSIKVGDRLSKTGGLFDETPCVAVLHEDGRVAGLLFIYNVRQAYDREVARKSLLRKGFGV